LTQDAGLLAHATDVLIGVRMPEHVALRQVRDLCVFQRS
jgi:hypothetical protein